MPIYEYRCRGCGRRVQLFFRSFSSVSTATCPHCHSTQLDRLPSRISRVRSESSYEDFLSDPSNLENVDYEDPRAVATWARRMGEAAGVDMGDDYEEMLDQMERGEDPGDLGFDEGSADAMSDFDDDL
ncbi:MAG TPA: zinc ribbon domain-containing protein [Chloroflexota bacterium]|nr:zinc ribbon domain-containing protein [Chloroflexota bacterium]